MGGWIKGSFFENGKRIVMYLKAEARQGRFLGEDMDREKRIPLWLVMQWREGVTAGAMESGVRRWDQGSRWRKQMRLTGCKWNKSGTERRKVREG